MHMVACKGGTIHGDGQQGSVLLGFGFLITSSELFIFYLRVGNLQLRLHDLFCFHICVK